MSCCCGGDAQEELSSGDEVTDLSAKHISYVAQAAYDKLRKSHNNSHHVCWNVTSGKIIGRVLDTPEYDHSRDWQSPNDPREGHSNWFPEKIEEIMKKTKEWCDVSSLTPPDGLFMKCMKRAIKSINDTAVEQRGPDIIIRLLFGNVIGQPCDCNAVIKELVELVPKDNCRIQLWVGAWRKGFSWNHAKIIAVDGKHLLTGGHNMWDPHYLRKDPVHDLSMEAEGRCANDGHIYLNHQWNFIEKMQSGCVGRLVDKLPDSMCLPIAARVTVSEFPGGEAKEFPPEYVKNARPPEPRSAFRAAGKAFRDVAHGFRHGHTAYQKRRRLGDGEVSMITMGRYGSIQGFDYPRLHKARPSDDAIVEMFDASQKSIRMALQDIGPVCFPRTKTLVPGPTGVWPAAYLKALGRALMRNVEVEIALSNPHSIPNSLSPTDANYGNGWECVDVASEIIKACPRDADLRNKVENNLRLCYIKQCGNNKWEDGETMAMHAKHFIIDDIAYYIGSQNLYVCDLAEWGILIDDKVQTAKVKKEYWSPMWAASYTHNKNKGGDCDMRAAMDQGTVTCWQWCWNFMQSKIGNCKFYCLPMAAKKERIRRAAGGHNCSRWATTTF